MMCQVCNGYLLEKIKHCIKPEFRRVYENYMKHRDKIKDLKEKKLINNIASVMNKIPELSQIDLSEIHDLNEKLIKTIEKKEHSIKICLTCGF